MNDTETKIKKEYIKPEAEIISLELEQPILTGSGGNFDNGGYWG